MRRIVLFKKTCRKMWLLLSLLCIFPLGGHSLLGVGVADSLNATQWSCYFNAGYGIGVVTVFHDGAINTNAASTINAGIQAKMIMYYQVLPCPNIQDTSCPNATDQVQSIIQYLKNNNIHVTSLVLEIDESSSANWSKNVTANIVFIEQFVASMISQEVYPLFFTNSADWQTITGNSKEFSPFELWYSDFDNAANYDDFSTFGGWTRPRNKQYQQNQNVCNNYVSLYYAKVEP